MTMMVLKHHSFFLLLGPLLLLWCLLFPSMSGIRVGSLNLNGARDIRKRALLFELIKQKGIDIALVQETHSDRANEVDWRKEWEGEVSFSHMSSTRGGVAVLFARRFLPISFEIEQVVEGRCMVVRAQFERFKFTIVNIYAPTSGVDRVAFLNTVNTALQNYSTDDYMFMGGDFNCNENEAVDRNHTEPHDASQRALRESLKAHGLCDVWRVFNKSVRQYTWAHV